MADDGKLKDNPPAWLYWLHCKLHAVLPVVLLVLLLIITAKIGFEMKHPLLDFGEIAIIGYFVSEILVDFILYKDKRVFLKDYWINIILILPFLAAFRLAGRVAQAANAARGLELFAGISEVTAMSGRFGRVSRFIGHLPKTQKIMHLFVDTPKALKKIKYVLPISLTLSSLRRKTEEETAEQSSATEGSDSENP